MSILLESERLYIKNPEAADFDNLSQIQTDPIVMKYIRSGRPYTPEEVNESLGKSIAHFQKYGYGFGTTFTKEDNKLVGWAGLIHLDYDDTQPEHEIGCILAKEVWGQGYGTELARAMVEWGFQNINIDKIFASIHPNHIVSQRTSEKIGMKFLKMGNYWGGEAKLFVLNKSNYLK